MLFVEESKVRKEVRMEQSELLLEYLQYRCNAYYSLKTIFIKEATMAQIRQLAKSCKKAGDLSDLPEAFRNYVAYFASITEEQVKDVRQEMKPEYARLFLGPKKLIAPPYESVYRSKRHCLYAEATDQVKQFYQNAGIKMSEKSKLPEDFLGTQLEFMYWMSHRMLQALNEEQYELMERMAIYQYEFLSQHLCMWIHDFKKDVVKGTTMQYFKVAAEYLVEFIEEDAAFLETWNS